jgi:hypothetical protein
VHINVLDKTYFKILTLKYKFRSIKYSNQSRIQLLLFLFFVVYFILIPIVILQFLAMVLPEKYFELLHKNNFFNFNKSNFKRKLYNNI